MKRKRTILPLIAVVCLFVGTNMMPIYATGTTSPGQDSQNDTIVAPDGMDIDSGSQSGTEFQDSHSLKQSDGAKVNFWINNTGSVAVKITINGEHERIIPPGANGHISASVAAPDKTYKFKAVPTPNGGKISIDFRIAQRDEEALFDENVSGGPDYVTIGFTASTDHDINVYFKNEGSEATTVTLQKKGFWGKWSDVAISGEKNTSFSVSAGNEDFQTYDGSSRTTYQVELVTPTGSDIYGRLRVNQKK